MLHISTEVTVVGVLTGLSYALLAAGLVLIYRATRVINFAHGQMGTFAVALFLLLNRNYHVPYLIALVAALGAGALLGAVIELGVVRRLAQSSTLILLVATLGVSQLLLFAQAVLPEVKGLEQFPVPFHRTIQIGRIHVLPEHFLILAVAPAAIVGLGLLISRTAFGRALRATADNQDAARLAGVNVNRLSTWTWALAGVLSVVTAFLVQPVRGDLANVPTAALGPSLLLRALAAGLVGRLVSLPATLAAGVGIGVVEAWLLSSYPTQPGLSDALLFVLILAMLLLRGPSQATDDAGAAKLVVRMPPIPRDLIKTPPVRAMRFGGAALGLAIGVVLPFIFTQSSSIYLLSRVWIFAIVGISITLMTGWAGQLSLGQFAFVGIGAVVTAALYQRGMPLAIAMIYATVAGALAALVVGVPALRIRGLFLAVTTLAFAVACQGYLLRLNFLAGSSSAIYVPPGRIGPIDFSSYRTYYFLCLAALIGAVYVAVSIRRFGAGRNWIAVRDNDRAAAAFTISPTVARLSAFIVSGAMAALAGALYAGLARRYAPTYFTPDLSLQAMSMAIVGGLGSVTGALLGAAYVVGIPSIFSDSVAATALTSGAGILILLMYFPGGLVGTLLPIRHAIVNWARRGAGGTVVPLPRSPVTTLARREHAVDGDAVSAVALAARDVHVAFGGRVALDGVTIEVKRGEIVGLIGSNGAGKTTLMNVISGFIPAAGRIELLGRDISSLPPSERARAGLGRAFQSARLFEGLTVHETILAALERRERTETVPAILGLPPARRAERARISEADDLVQFLGLGRYANTFIDQLSTGTRRITELCCLLALRSPVLLLDEPTAGVAQRESEAFGPLIRRIRQELDASVLIIEHDMPLVMSMSDTVFCLGSGHVLASGEPESVRRDPAVIASYLGTDERAILRSGALTS